MVEGLERAFMPYLRRKLIRASLDHYRLRLWGIHGAAHWINVLENGLRLAERTGADRHVTALFALIHDLGRRDDGLDKEHGRRSAEIARKLRFPHLEVSDRQFELLYQACAEHPFGGTEGDITVCTCWDADRLDLVRLGCEIDPGRLCTAEARKRRVRPGIEQCPIS